MPGAHAVAFGHRKLFQHAAGRRNQRRQALRRHQLPGHAGAAGVASETQEQHHDDGDRYGRQRHQAQAERLQQRNAAQPAAALRIERFLAKQTRRHRLNLRCA